MSRDGVKSSPPRIQKGKATHYRRLVLPQRQRLRKRVSTRSSAMKRTIAAVVVTLSLFGADRSFAQAERVGPGAVEVTIIPGGGTFFAQKGRSPSFGNYDLGGSLT
jgi:hypothetical protein